MSKPKKSFYEILAWWWFVGGPLVVVIAVAVYVLYILITGAEPF